MGTLSVEAMSRYIYTRLTKYTRYRDTLIDEDDPPLLRFIESLFHGYYPTTWNTETQEWEISGDYVTGAGEYVLEKANAFTTLIDPDDCPDDIFPYLFESFGLPYNPLIETRTDADGKPIIYYHRKFLSNIGELLKRRGSKAGLQYLIRVLTGFEIRTKYVRGWVDDNGDVVGENDGGKYGRHLLITLLLNSVEDEQNMEHSKRVIEQFLYPFLPHYLNIHIGVSQAYVELDVQSAVMFTPMYTVENPVLGGQNKENDGKE